MAAEMKQAPKKQLNIEIVSDNICPWCFVGKRNLETALSNLNKNEVDINISWTAYELDPTLPKYGSIDKKARYVSKFGSNKFNVISRRLTNVGLLCSPPINFQWGGKVGNTLNSHRLVMYAKTFNKHNETTEMIMHYYFELNQDISDIHVLAEIGQNVGLSKVYELLKGKEFVDEVGAELKRSREELEISGVPTFIINDQKKNSGGRASDFFLMTFQALGFEVGDGQNNENIKIKTQDYIFKNINWCNNKIICLDGDFNDVIFELPKSKDLLEKIIKVIKEGQDKKKDVTVTVSIMSQNEKETKTVSDVIIA